MSTDQAELEREREYFDTAYDAREEIRRKLLLQPEMASSPGAAVGIRKNLEARLEQLGDPDSEIAAGRVDLDQEDPVYLGKREIYDARRDTLVYSWAHPFAEAFYRPTSSEKLQRKRTYESDGRRLVSFADLVLGDLADELGRLTDPKFDDVLLEELGRSRTGEMQDIVRTIQAAQHELLTGEIDQLLVVQGGPGTGKTAVALHRAVWLLYNHKDTLRPQDILVVGPNRVFMGYIGRVLPTLGAGEVVQRSTANIAPLVSTELVEPDDVVALKGDSRMKVLLRRGLADRVRDLDEDLDVVVRGERGRITAAEVRARIGSLRNLPYDTGRTELLTWLREELGRRRIDHTLATAEIDRYHTRVWPDLTPQQFLRDLLGSEARLVGAAGDDFTAGEVRRLYRRSAERISQEQWSIADLPLLDHALHLIKGQADQYQHIVIDEAQDLSPMQLDMLRRRSSNGSMTVLGDIAQSTGLWARHDWGFIQDELAGPAPVVAAELEYGYRVPEPVFALASQLLPYIAPDITPPVVVRPGAEPRFVQVAEDDRHASALAEAREALVQGWSVGVIVAPSQFDEIGAAFTAKKVRWIDGRTSNVSNTGIVLLDPVASKGLEFDAVVVVEPEAIVESDPQGLRLLYVALTRCTTQLSIVHSGASLPIPAGDEPVAGPAASLFPSITPTVEQQELDIEQARGETEQIAPVRPTSSSGGRIVGAVAGSLAEEIRSTVDPAMWPAVLDALRQALETDGAEPNPGEEPS